MFWNEEWTREVSSEQVALVDKNGTCITYKELDEVAANLKATGVKRELVFMLTENEIGCLGGYYSVMADNMVPLLLDAKLDRALLTKLIETYQPAYLWINQKNYQEFPEYSSIFEYEGFGLLKTNFESVPLHEDLAILLTTSGSTGSPKLVRVSRQNLRCNTNMLAQNAKLTCNDIGITTMPPNYSYGMAILNMHWCSGARMVVTDATVLQQEFWDLFVENQVTNLGGVPYTYELLSHYVDFLETDYKHLRVMTQTGGKLSEQNQKEFTELFRKQGKELLIWYGQTEASGGLTYLSTERGIEKLGSIGIPFPGVEVEIISENPNDVSADASGELVFKCDSISMGYALNKEDLSKGDERNHILYTGDLAKIDNDGYLFLLGRINRLIKILGKRISLDEIEVLLKNQYAGIECACKGEDDLLEIYYAGDYKEKEITIFAGKILGINPRQIVSRKVDNIPRKESGKIDYGKLKH